MGVADVKPKHHCDSRHHTKKKRTRPIFSAGIAIVVGPSCPDNVSWTTGPIVLLVDDGKVTRDGVLRVTVVAVTVGVVCFSAVSTVDSYI